MNRIASTLFLVCAAAALDCWYFSGLLSIFHCAEFTLCLVAALAVFAPEPLAAAAALAGGFVLDALGEKLLFLPLLFATTLCVRWLGGLFYSPGSVYHLAGSILVLWVAVGVKMFFIYIRTGALSPLPAMAGALLLNSLVFLCFAAPARKFWEEERSALRLV